MNMLNKPPWLEKFSRLIKIIRDNNGEARFVGGSVRDAILNKAVSDFDLATNLLPEKIIAILAKNNIKIIPTGLKHGTVTALFAGTSLEITTLRTDISCDGRWAQVQFTDQWQEDAKRRDFTFNALYLDLEGNIYDYFSGIKDLAQGRLIFVGEPEKRIQEDYLRILRAFRFYTNLCVIPIDAYTLATCQKYRKNLNILSGERICAEMFKLLSYPKAIETLIIMQNYQILQEVLNIELDFDLINIERAKNITNFITKLALLLLISKTAFTNRKADNNSSSDAELQSNLEWLFNRWRFNKAIYKKLKSLVSNKLWPNPKKNLVEFGRENAIAMLEINYSLINTALTPEQFAKKQQELLQIEIPVFPILGQDIKDLGFFGKAIGEVLEKLHLQWEESDYHLSKEELLQLVERG